MFSSWRDKLQALLDTLSGVRTDKALADAGNGQASGELGTEARRPELGRVQINLGIDFGTSFTKICFRDVATEESGIVTAGDGFKSGLISSVVLIAADGRLCLEDEPAARSAPIRVPYLKMRLAGSPLGDQLPAIDGFDLNSRECVSAMASWFLASVLARSQLWMQQYEKDRLKNRRVDWSANVGVPVEHYDSDVIDTFRAVLGVAWLWIKDGEVPGTLAEVVAAYDTTAARLREEVTDFHAIPEIAAAVHSFVMSREAVPGVYVYFDIGGGTVDGVSFKFLNNDGARRINFYSGKVAPLGISAFAAKLSPETGDIDARQLQEMLIRAPRALLNNFANAIRQLVGYVVVTAKKKDVGVDGDWRRDAIQNREFERKFIGQLQPSQVQPLVVFVGGGGSHSNWYKSSINSTYREFNHNSVGIPPYKLLQVPKPQDLTMPGLDGSQFIRFAISYGLSIPFGEGPEVRLPKQFSERPRLPPSKRSDVIDYGDSKDVYD